MRDTRLILSQVRLPFRHSSIMPVLFQPAAKSRPGLVYLHGFIVSIPTWSKSRDLNPEPHAPKARHLPIDILLDNGGAEEIRTLDFYLARVALYQLSYSPITDDAYCVARNLFYTCRQAMFHFTTNQACCIPCITLRLPLDLKQKQRKRFAGLLFAFTLRLGTLTRRVNPTSLGKRPNRHALSFRITLLHSCTLSDYR